MRKQPNPMPPIGMKRPDPPPRPPRVREDNTEHVLKGAHIDTLPVDKEDDEKNAQMRSSDLWPPRVKSTLRVREKMSKARAFIEEVKNVKKLTPALKAKINKDLSAISSGNKYYDAIPMGTIKDILEKHGLLILQEDGQKWSGILLGASSHDTFDIGYIDSQEEEDYTIIDNASLIMSWHKMPSGRYEVIVYVG